MKIFVKYRIVSFRDCWLPPVWKLQERNFPHFRRWRTLEMTSSPNRLIEWIKAIGFKNLEIKRHA